jgi:hypothetical protein
MEFSLFNSHDTLLIPSFDECILIDNCGALPVAPNQELSWEETELDPRILLELPSENQDSPISNQDTPNSEVASPTFETTSPMFSDFSGFQNAEHSNPFEEEVRYTKRVKLEEGELQIFPSTVRLTKKQLLQVSGEAYEAHIKKIRSFRRLSEEEEAVHREQKRLIRNREAASFSRAKKKSQIDTLSEQLTYLENERSTMEKQIDRLTVENLWIKNEVEFLSKLVQQSQPLTTAFDLFTKKVEVRPTAGPSFSHSPMREERSERATQMKALYVPNSAA